MDFSTIVGLVAGIALLVSAITLKGGGSGYLDLGSIMITLGGTVAATIVACPLTRLRKLVKVTSIAFSPKPQLVSMNTVSRLVSFSEIARREGLLAIEDAVADVDDEFLKKGMQLVVDGTDPETVRNILEMEIALMEERHATGRGMFETMGKYAPAFGMIGTLIGLIQMLGNLDDPEQIGPAMAVALLTTFYGAVLANLVFLPIAEKLHARSQEEITYQEMVVEGVLSIQAGENPRLLREKLVSFLPAGGRVEQEEPASGEEAFDAGGDAVEA